MTPRRHAPEEMPSDDGMFADAPKPARRARGFPNPVPIDYFFSSMLRKEAEAICRLDAGRTYSEAYAPAPQPQSPPPAHEILADIITEQNREPSTYRDAVADLLRSRPGEWIDGQEIARVGGAYAWRTRVSDARLQLGLDIENRQRKVGKRTISEYRIRPSEKEGGLKST